jgi:hypothetical protein
MKKAAPQIAKHSVSQDARELAVISRLFKIEPVVFRQALAPRQIRTLRTEVTIVFDAYTRPHSNCVT